LCCLGTPHWLFCGCCGPNTLGGASLRALEALRQDWIQVHRLWPTAPQRATARPEQLWAGAMAWLHLPGSQPGQHYLRYRKKTPLSLFAETICLYLERAFSSSDIWLHSIHSIVAREKCKLLLTAHLQSAVESTTTGGSSGKQLCKCSAVQVNGPCPFPKPAQGRLRPEQPYD